MLLLFVSVVVDGIVLFLAVDALKRYYESVVVWTVGCREGGLHMYCIALSKKSEMFASS